MNLPPESMMDNPSKYCGSRGQDAHFQQHVLAASFGGAVSAIVTCPFDVVKTRLQIAPSAQAAKNPRFAQQVFSGTLDAFVKIVRNEGILTLWRGLAPSLIMTVPNAVIYFSAYETLKKHITRLDITHSALVPLVSGSLARVIAVGALAPLEFIRTNFQGSTSRKTPTVLSFVRKTGMKGLWLGVGATLSRDVPFSAIYWTFYELIKGFLKAELPQSTSGAFLTSFIAGCSSGMLSAILTTPIDLVKTHVQTRAHDPNACAKGGSSAVATAKQLRARDIARIIYKEEGARGFMKGWLPRAVKVGPACAIMISSYELIKSLGSTTDCRG